MKGVRIAYVVNAGLPNTKAHGLQIASMSEAFGRLGCEVTLFSPRRRVSEGREFSEFHGLRHRVRHTLLPNRDVVRLERAVPAPLYRSLYLAHAIGWALYATAKVGRAYDLYVTRDAPTAFWFTRLGFPTIFEVHTMPRGPQRHLLRAIAKAPGLRATVALTSCTRSELGAFGFDTRMVHVLPDGVDLEMFQASEDRRAVRTRMGLPRDRVIVGYVGSLRAVGCDKGVMLLVEAVASLRASARRQVPFLVVVGGAAEESREYAQRAATLGLGPDDVHFQEHVDHADVPSWMRGCDLLVVPSPGAGHLTHHSSPLKVFEYMASGGAIIASDLPALRDVLVHGRNAILFEAENRSALAAAIAQFVDDASFRSRCQSNASHDAAGYSWDDRARRVLAAAAAASVSEGAAGLTAVRTS